MFDVEGRYNIARIFNDNVEQETIAQIINLCNQEFTQGSKIRIMPDCHVGAGCTIGTTMTLTDKVVPNLVGVDIGCGMSVLCFSGKGIKLDKLDEYIRENIPAGHNILDHEVYYPKLDSLICLKHINKTRALSSIGTLGGGNHFIEVNTDEDNLYVVVHSGSRYLGKQVAEYYQDRAYKTLTDNRSEIEGIVRKLKAEGRHGEIQETIKNTKRGMGVGIPKELAYLQGPDMMEYLHDMVIAQEYASANRKAILDRIEVFLEKSLIDYKKYANFQTVHNYIDFNNMMLRKGAVSAKEDELLIIPMNMRDGSLICLGRGNEDWNCSAPHGAGRLFSRSRAKELISLVEFKESMEGIYTTSVCKSTIDESAFAYKPMEEIICNIGGTVKIVKIIRPLYNFKSSDA